MNFLEKYKKEFEEYDQLGHDFIDDDKIWAQLNKWENPSKEDVRRVLKKAEQCVRLEPEETAILIQNRDESTLQEMYELAHQLKEEVYGDRIVFFAPLYISDECANNCLYCGFRSSNKTIQRKTLTMDEIEKEVRIMIGEGQKRTVLVYGESPKTKLIYVRDNQKVYSVKTKHGEIRRANINCAPLTVDELKNSRMSASAHSRSSRKPTTTIHIARCTAGDDQGHTAGGFTAWTGPSRRAWTTTASAFCLVCTTGALR
jgi:2-iminoacetate synthase